MKRNAPLTSICKGWSRKVRDLCAGVVGAVVLGVFGIGSASAQTTSAFEVCGGTRLVVAPTSGTPTDDTAFADARRILNARMAGRLGQNARFVRIVDGRIEVNLPKSAGSRAVIDPMLARVDISFHPVYTRIDTGREITLAQGQMIVPDRMLPHFSYVVETAAIVDGDDIVTAAPVLDYAQRPAVEFAFSQAGAETFTTFTQQNIGRQFAIVLDGAVLSAPTVRDAITNGRGILTGSFSNDEARNLAEALDGGILPYDLEVVEDIRVDGSNPSADFCP